MSFLNLKKKIVQTTLILSVVLSIFAGVGFITAPKVADAQIQPNVALPWDTSQAALAKNNQLAAQIGAAKPENGCDTFSFGCKIVTAIGRIILTLTSFLMWLGAIVFNYIIDFTLVNFKGNITAIKAIDIGWTVFRDLANIFFIFILLYIAIATILRLETINTKKVLSTLIVVGLLLNFSLFFTKVIVDGSNILSLVFFSKITVNGNPIESSPSDGSKAAFNNTLANAFAAPLGLADLLGGGVFSSGVPTNGVFAAVGDINETYPSLFLIELFAGAIFLILAFVFLAASFLFISRFVILIFLMLLSPLAFAGMILPKTKGMIADKWWKALIDQCLFAPVFFMNLWVVLAIISSPNFLKVGQGATFTQLFTDPAGAAKGASIVLNFMLVIALLIGTLIISKLLGAHGASGAISIGNNIATSARKGAQGYLGRGAVRLSGAAGIENALQNTKFGESAPMRALRSVTTGAAVKAKFGSKDSVGSVNKADKARAEGIAKRTDEKISSTFKENLPAIRAARQKAIPTELAATLATTPIVGDAATHLKDSEQKLADLKKNAPTVIDAAYIAKIKAAQTTVDNTKKVIGLREEQTTLASIEDYRKKTGVVQDATTDHEKDVLRGERLKGLQLAAGKTNALIDGPGNMKTGALRGAATGAAIGALAGPLGAAVGAAVGAGINTGFRTGAGKWISKTASSISGGAGASADSDKATAKRLAARLAGKNLERDELLKELASEKKAAETPPKTK